MKICWPKLSPHLIELSSEVIGIGGSLQLLDGLLRSHLEIFNRIEAQAFPRSAFVCPEEKQVLTAPVLRFVGRESKDFTNHEEQFLCVRHKSALSHFAPFVARWIRQRHSSWRMFHRLYTLFLVTFFSATRNSDTTRGLVTH